MAITATVAQNGDADDQGYGSTGDTVLSMSADIKFQSSCEYDHGDNDQYDWNKLIGFGDGGFATRSARWGWRWNLTNKKVEIAPYVRSQGSFILPPPEQWIQLDLNDWFNAKIEIDRANNKYIFTYVNGGSPIVHEVGVTEDLTGTYNGACVTDLFFFGGTKKAPHEMKIDYDNITFTTPPRKYYITGESSGGVTVTGLYPDGSTPYSQYLAMNQTELTPCLKKNSLSTTDVTIVEESFCE